MAKKLLPLLLMVGWATSPGSALAQEPSAEFEGLVEVTEVLLDVLATDNSGELIAGLGKEDFIVEENGEPVDLTGVSFYTTRYGPGGEITVNDGEIPSSRYFIFFFHDQIRTTEVGTRLVRQQLEASRQSRRWVEEQMLPSDWVAVVSYDVKLKIHVDYTQDRFQILEAISSASRNKDPEKNVGRGGRRLPPSGAPSLLRSLPQGKELRKKTTRIYDGVRLLADASRFIVGRKNLLMFTIGFGELGRATPVPVGDPRYYPSMEQALNDANVAVYTIDLTPPRFEHLQSSFMNQLANDTGGFYFDKFVNFITPIQEIAAENVGYYVLSYQSEHPAAESGYQEVKVKARDRKVNVRARKGYLYGSSGG
ncbi:MAG: VWA domain-containing protein [Acidobacteriota bacterium]